MSFADTNAAQTAVPIVDELLALKLIPPECREVIVEQFLVSGFDSSRVGFLKFLAECNILTPFQADRVELGQANRLVCGPYQLKELIGSGSLGHVYKAVYPGKPGEYALKQLPLRSMWNVVQAKKQVKSFQSVPAQSAVVPFVDVDTAGGVHYLVWPFVQGETFESIVKQQGSLTPEYVVRWSVQILQGLAGFHNAGIAHGLLKPSNLLLTRDRKAKILDFGIGAILSENLSDDESMIDTISTANTAMNTIDCTPPETFADPTVRTPAGDLYSLGCTIYFLLTGSYPFPDGNVVDKMIAHQTQNPRPLREVCPQVSIELEAIVASLMAKNPADRPTNDAALTERLSASTPASSRLTEDDIPMHPNRASGLQGSKATGNQKDPLSSSYLDTEDAINFNLGYTPTDDRQRNQGRAPGPQDSAAINYFEESESEVEVPKPAFQPAQKSSNKRPISIPELPDVTKKIVLPPLIQEKPTVPGVKSKSTSRLPGVKALPSTIQYQTPQDLDSVEFTLPPVVVPPPPYIQVPFLQRLKRAILFWQAPYDLLQFSLFGPTYIMPGHRYIFQVCAHLPEAFAGVRTLSRAFQGDAELRGAGFGQQLIQRGSRVGLHLAVANAGVAKSLLHFHWFGQSKPWKFEVFVPWESPIGRTPGMLSVGLGNETVAQIPFSVVVLSRSS